MHGEQNDALLAAAVSSCACMVVCCICFLGCDGLKKMVVERGAVGLSTLEGFPTHTVTGRDWKKEYVHFDPQTYPKWYG